MKFEWKIFPRFTTIAILNEIQQMMGELQCEPENFTGRIIFMSMLNDTVWDAKRNGELCVNNSKAIKKDTERFPRGHFHGAVADIIAELPVCRGTQEKPVASCQLDEQEILHNLLSQNCKSMKSDRENHCKNTSNGLRNY